MATANEQSYAEAINLLGQFNNAMSENCSVLQGAINTCRDNMQGDYYAGQAVARTSNIVNGINMNLELIKNVATELEAQMERLIEIKNRVNFDD